MMPASVSVLYFFVNSLGTPHIPDLNALFRSAEENRIFNKLDRRRRQLRERGRPIYSDSTTYYYRYASAGNGRFKTDLHQHHEHKSYAKYKTGKRIPNARNYIRGVDARGVG